MNTPLDGYDTFIDDFVEFLTLLSDLMRYGRGTVRTGPISLHVSISERLMKRITSQIRAAAK